MKKYLVLLLFTQTFGCFRRKTDSPKISPAPTPYISYKQPLVNDKRIFNAAKLALKLADINSAFDRFNELTNENQKAILQLLFMFYKTPEKSELKDDNLGHITQVYTSNQLPDAWRVYVAKKKKVR